MSDIKVHTLVLHQTDLYQTETERHYMIRCGLFFQNERTLACSSSCDSWRWGGLWLIMEEKHHALHADAVLQGRKITLGVSDGSIHHHCAKTDEIESEVSTETPVTAKCHVCMIIQNQRCSRGETCSLVSKQTQGLLNLCWRMDWNFDHFDTFNSGRSDFSDKFVSVSKVYLNEGGLKSLQLQQLFIKAW